MNDRELGLVQAALKRAVSQIDTLVKRKPRLEPGGYPVNLRVEIEGDIDIGKGSSSERESKTFTDAQLLDAMFLVLDETESERIVGEALAKLKLVQGGRIKDEFKAAKGARESVVFRVAKKRGMLESSLVRQAGKVNGKPRVHVAGSIGENTVDVEAEAA